MQTHTHTQVAAAVSLCECHSVQGASKTQTQVAWKIDWLLSVSVGVLTAIHRLPMYARVRLCTQFCLLLSVCERETASCLCFCFAFWRDEGRQQGRVMHTRTHSRAVGMNDDDGHAWPACWMLQKQMQMLHANSTTYCCAYYYFCYINTYMCVLCLTVENSQSVCLVCLFEWSDWIECTVINSWCVLCKGKYYYYLYYFSSTSLICVHQTKAKDCLHAYVYVSTDTHPHRYTHTHTQRLPGSISVFLQGILLQWMTSRICLSNRVWLQRTNIVNSTNNRILTDTLFKSKRAQRAGCAVMQRLRVVPFAGIHCYDARSTVTCSKQLYQYHHRGVALRHVVNDVLKCVLKQMFWLDVEK